MSFTEPFVAGFPGAEVPGVLAVELDGALDDEELDGAAELLEAELLLLLPFEAAVSLLLHAVRPSAVVNTTAVPMVR